MQTWQIQALRETFASDVGNMPEAMVRCLLPLIAGLVACQSSVGPVTTTAKQNQAQQAVSSNLLPALAKPAAIVNEGMATALVCQRCHGKHDTLFRDRNQRDLSIHSEWSVSLMGLATRDPYFLAALERELASGSGGLLSKQADADPARQRSVARFCLKCHAPLADSSEVSMPKLAGNGLALDGVSCLACHSAKPESIVAASNATIVLRRDSVVYGSRPDPQADAMKQMIKFGVEPSRHLVQSALCGSCHSVVVPVAGEPLDSPTQTLIEQGTYFEWQASAFSTEAIKPNALAKDCIACHMSTVDDSGAPLRGPISSRPPKSVIRENYRRHDLVGASSYLLARLATATNWLAEDQAISPSDLQAAAQRSEKFLTTAAKLTLELQADGLVVTVHNLTGHKLPTGFLERRMWLSVTATDATGRLVFSSGEHHQGELAVPSRGRHVNELTDRGEPAVWQALPLDRSGQPTHLLLGVATIGLDNRILPLGFDPRKQPGVAPTGTQGDTDFIAGRDSVIARLPATFAKVEVSLWYQSIPPAVVRSYRGQNAPAANRFVEIASVPNTPTLLAREVIIR